MIVLVPLFTGGWAGQHPGEFLGAILWCGWAAAPYLAYGLLSWKCRSNLAASVVSFLATGLAAGWGNFVYFRDYVYPTAHPGFSWAIIVIPVFQWFGFGLLALVVASTSVPGAHAPGYWLSSLRDPSRRRDPRDPAPTVYLVPAPVALASISPWVNHSRLARNTTMLLALAKPGAPRPVAVLLAMTRIVPSWATATDE